MRIAIIGSGYVGLVTGGCFAEIGHQVVCADNDPAKVRALTAGQLPIYEPHLDGIIAKNRQAGRLRFTGDLGECIRTGEVVFICVGTPPLETGEADLTAIDKVARTIASEAQSPKLVIEKSTVPAQTGQQLQRALSVYSRNPGVTFRVASNPEFLREGTAMFDFLHPDRIVVGVQDGESERQLRDLYQPLLERRFNCPVHAHQCPPAGPPPFLVTTINSAELIKHASNSFLALKISYANTLADLCERLGANIDEVTHAIGLDARIGPQFLRAGIGFGGSCLPKDVQAFIRLAERVGVDFGLLKETERINRQRLDHFCELIRRTLWVVREKQIGILGLAFKPNTDDVRSAPALELIRRLKAEGARVRAFDPQAMERTREVHPDIHYAKDAYEVAEDTDALLIVTEWPDFAGLDWKRIRDHMARPLVLDGRNLLDPARMKELGFEYHSVGRPSNAAPLAAAP